ncbi:MAG TPA: lmo0937 family membrane protein [Bryobacteraceae bacterium]|nr:lmo0937 family membrane protein [Bryobacteraceae bacterium]
MRVLADFFFLILFFVLLVGWLVAWAAYHVAGGAIHLLLIIAVISLIMHFFRGRSTV